MAKKLLKGGKDCLFCMEERRASRCEGMGGGKVKGAGSDRRKKVRTLHDQARISELVIDESQREGREFANGGRRLYLIRFPPQELSWYL